MVPPCLIHVSPSFLQPRAWETRLLLHKPGHCLLMLIKYRLSEHYLRFKRDTLKRMIEEEHTRTPALTSFLELASLGN